MALISREAQRRVGGALQNFPKLAKRLAGAPVTSAERGARTRVRGLARVSRGRVALVGDASGTVDAITAEGISLGLRQGEALANALAAGTQSRLSDRR